jgi:sortase B
VKKLLKVLIILILLGIFLFSGFKLGDYYLDWQEQEKTVAELREELEEAIDKDNPYGIDQKGYLRRYKKLHKENPDMIGWLTIKDTPIDYPVMQSTKDDPEYYLHRDFHKNQATAGTLFLDADCSLKRPSDNLIIYGHHMRNGSMFGKLEKYEDSDFYKNHKVFTFDTLKEHREYKVLAVFRGQAYAKGDTEHFHYYDFFDAKNEKDFDSFIKEVTERSQYDTGVTAQYGDQLLTLSTCAYHREQGRFVVVAKRII